MAILEHAHRRLPRTHKYPCSTGVLHIDAGIFTVPIALLQSKQGLNFRTRAQTGADFDAATNRYDVTRLTILVVAG